MKYVNLTLEENEAETLCAYLAGFLSNLKLEENNDSELEKRFGDVIEPLRKTFLKLKMGMKNSV